MQVLKVWYSHAAIHVRFCVSFKALPTAAVAKATITGMAVFGEGRVLLRVAFMKPSRKLVPDLHATAKATDEKHIVVIETHLPMHKMNKKDTKRVVGSWLG